MTTGRGIVAILGAAGGLGELVDVAPVEDRRGHGGGFRARAAGGLEQRRQQFGVGHVQVDLALFVADADRDFAAGRQRARIPAVLAAIGHPAQAPILARDPPDRVFQAGARQRPRLGAARQHLALQVFGARGEREAADHCGEQRHQPQHQQQCGAARLHRAPAGIA